MSKLKLTPGVVTGNQLKELYAFCKEHQCALPAVNVIGSHSINSALAAARASESAVIIQFSNGGSQFNAGKTLDNSAQAASIHGAIAGAMHIHHLAPLYGVPVVLHTDHAEKKLIPWVEGMVAYGEEVFRKNGSPLFSSHMLDLSELSLEENLETCARMLERIARIDMSLEIELGVTGGEEDGVDNSDVDNAKLYTQPEDVLAAYDRLHKIGHFTVAASFGNVHGVYKPGNVQLRPEILRNSQARVKADRGTGDKPLDFVFHGGSGSSQAEIREAVSYGVIKMNIDTDTQWAFAKAVKNYMDEKDAYLQSQIGNPEGEDKPNKKHIDPRVWLHLAEKSMADRLKQAFEDLNSAGKFVIG